MTRTSKSSFHVYHAVQAAKAVVVRRGPSKWWHFLLWDLDMGIVQPGSWFSGMVYPARCDFSPRGDAFLMVAYKGTNDPIAWTVISRPPSVRADVFWPQETAALGGGLFDSRLPIIWLNLRPEKNQVDIRTKCTYEFGYLDEEHKGYGGLRERLIRDGWAAREIKAGDALGGLFPETDPEQEAEPTVTRWTTSLPKTKLTLILEHPGGAPTAPPTAPPTEDPAERHYFLQTHGHDPIPIEGATWAGWNKRGQVCYLADGILYTAEIKSGDVESKIVMDLNGLAPPAERVLRESR
ncbi:MAG: hypothetical protein JJU11_14525 [Candidatus Sumerlaeia bacterium]|nr:hypothetical protein [Candidatus Sumerlaeia bacterium]